MLLCPLLLEEAEGRHEIWGDVEMVGGLTGEWRGRGEPQSELVPEITWTGCRRCCG